MASQRHERPARLADGYFMVATDFLWALFMGGFRQEEKLLVLAAIEKSWAPGLVDGSREPRPFRLRLSRLARKIGIRRQNADRAFNRLVACGVFVDLGMSYGHVIEKDYNSWTAPDGSPRFTDVQLFWIAKSGVPNGNRIDGDNPDLMPAVVATDGYTDPTNVLTREYTPSPDVLTREYKTAKTVLIRDAGLYSPVSTNADAPSNLDGSQTPTKSTLPERHAECERPRSERFKKTRKTPLNPPETGGTSSVLSPRGGRRK